MRTIRVTGKGRIKVRPDLARITLTLEGGDIDYAKTLSQSSKDTETLRETLSAFGFESQDLKTLAFSVDTEYESYEEGGIYKQRFIGYKFRHTLKVEFLSDNARLGKILYALANCPAKPEFRLSYTVEDPEKAKNELLGKAIRDAREKAEVLTASAGVTLKGIQSIDYSWGEIEFETRPMNRALMAKDSAAPLASYAGSLDLNIEPDDIEATDTVTVLWELE